MLQSNQKMTMTGRYLRELCLEIGISLKLLRIGKAVHINAHLAIKIFFRRGSIKNALYH